MSRDTSPNLPERETVSADADVWGIYFAKLLGKVFLDDASAFSGDVSISDLRRAAVTSLVKALIESGATSLEAKRLLQETARSIVPTEIDVRWTGEMNERRLQLIDKKIQRSLSRDEADELERLTEVLRRKFDTEEMVPLESARSLHERLSRLDESETDTT